MDYKTLFSKTPPTKLFLFAAIPGSIGMLASALYQLIDGILVGRILGDTAFAALNLAMPLVIINFSLADLIGVGASVPISIRLGEKKEKEANNLFTCSCLLIVGTSLLFGGLMFLLAPSLIHFMGAKAELARLAIAYLRVYALCAPVTTIIFAVDNYLRICGKIRGSMFLNIFMSILTAVLEFTFLYLFDWGIWAAALATCSGMFICSLIAFYPFFRGKLQLRFCKPQFHLAMIKQIILCGSPNFLNNIAARITSIFMNILLLRMGGEIAVSVYGILMFADGFVQPLLYGMCDSLQPAIGYNWGTRDYSRVKAIAKRCFIASFVLSIASAIVIIAFPEQLVHLFTSNADGTLMDMAVIALLLFSTTYITRWFSFATQSFMAAIEQPIFASIISISTALLFPILMVILLWPMGLNGLWLNMPTTALLSAILSIIILKRFQKIQQKN